MGPLLTTITGMLQRLSGDRLDPEEARIRVIALFRQAFAFRVARALALRMTGWSAISAPQADAIRFVILSQLDRSEEHTSALQSLIRNSYAVFCLKKKTSIIIST